ncbi:MAG: hypothetical protein PSY14_06580 [bacterium]|nr:hypothetical protein [bacterium]
MKRLSSIFNLKSMVFAAGLAVGGVQAMAMPPSAIAANDDTAKTRPAPASVMAPNYTSQLKPPDPHGPALKLLKDEFGRTPLGHALLLYAEAQHITIKFDAAIAVTNNYAQYVPENSTITVRPDLALEEQVMYLAHELRHAWQDKTLDYSGLNAKRLTPVQRFSLQRYVEADAHAFASFFWADRMQRLGVDPAAVHAGYELTLAHQLRAKMDGAGDVRPADYRDIALLPYFDHLENYNARHVAMAARATDTFRAEVRAAQEEGQSSSFNRLAADIAAAPDDASFAAWLRKLGSTLLAVDGLTALSGETDAALLGDYALRGLDGHELMPALGSASVVMPPPRARLERLQASDAKQRAMVQAHTP